jgi:hypothetical protein
VEVKAGNLAAARDLFQRSLKVAEELAKADPQNSVATFDVVLSHLRFIGLAAQEANVEELQEHVAAANELLSKMDAKGQVRGHQQREAVEEFLASLAAELAKLP